jgi:hypothetical protein
MHVPAPEAETSLPVALDLPPRKHVVMFSAGGGSWMTALRVSKRHGTENLHLLFTDTMFESPDTYQFLILASADIYGITLPEGLVPALSDFPSFRDRPAFRAFLGALRERVAPHIPNLHWIADGRDIWQVFFDERFLANSGIDPCSKILKRLISYKWLEDTCDPANTTVYVGIDFTETHRFDDGQGGGVGPRRAADGWTYEAPLTQQPFVWRPDIIEEMKSRDLMVPTAYLLGFSHNNCNKGCVKAGHEHWLNLLRKDRDLYLYYEELEQEFRDFLGADVSILTDRAGDNKKKVLTLRIFRTRFEEKKQLDFLFDEEFAGAFNEGVGGCGCMLETDGEARPTKVSWCPEDDVRLGELVREVGLGDNALKFVASKMGCGLGGLRARLTQLGVDLDAHDAEAAALVLGSSGARPKARRKARKNVPVPA